MLQCFFRGGGEYQGAEDSNLFVLFYPYVVFSSLCSNLLPSYVFINDTILYEVIAGFS